MGDILQVLIILGIIGFAVVKQVLKTNKQINDNQAPPVYIPDGEEDYYPEMSLDAPPPPPAAVTVQQFKARQKDTLHTPSKSPRQALKSHLQETEDVTQEFDIHSPEEIRRGIIWSEILNRKY